MIKNEKIGLFHEEVYYQVEKDDSLWNIIKSLRPKASDQEIQKDVDQMIKINDIKNPDLIQIGEFLKIPDTSVPDITVDLNDRMRKNSQDSLRNNPFEFRNKVRNKGDWDLKNQKDTVYESGKYKNYKYDGEIIRSDAPGNMNYGYAGKSAWWTTDNMLYKQAGKAQKKAGTSKDEWDAKPYYGDDPYDHEMIKKGIELYEKDKKNNTDSD